MRGAEKAVRPAREAGGLWSSCSKTSIRFRFQAVTVAKATGKKSLVSQTLSREPFKSCTFSYPCTMKAPWNAWCLRHLLVSIGRSAVDVLSIGTSHELCERGWTETKLFWNKRVCAVAAVDAVSWVEGEMKRSSMVEATSWLARENPCIQRCQVSGDVTW